MARTGVNNTGYRQQKSMTVRELAIFGLLGAVMYASKILMEALPNIHLLGVFTIALTLVYRRRALYPIYAYVFINGLFAGFSLWWIPYLYVWTVLWAAAMLLPRDTVEKGRVIPCMLLCGLHGLLFGTLYAPAQAVMFGLDFKGMIAWIIAGLPWDAVHCAANFTLGSLIVPLARIIKLADRDSAF